MCLLTFLKKTIPQLKYLTGQVIEGFPLKFMVTIEW